MHAVSKEIEEFESLSKQHEAKRFYIFCSEVFQLKNLLQCSICLEVYDSPTELYECKHLFCKDCIEECWEYSGGSCTCPICQGPFDKNQINGHSFFEKISEFVKYALKHIYMILGDGCRKLPSYVQVHQLWEQNSHLTDAFNSIKNILESTVTDIKDSIVLNNQKIVIEANEKFPSDLKNVTEEGDAFDALLKMPVQNQFFNQQNPFFNNKVYIVKKGEKENTMPKPVHNPQKFEDEANKIEVLKWLENGNNEFNFKSFSPTPKFSIDIPDFDMPSVSQTIAFRKPKFVGASDLELKKQKQMQSEIREKSNMLVRLSRPVHAVRNKSNRQEKRTRSLEYCIKTLNAKPRVKRHSLPICSQDEEIVIEQFDSEKDILQKENPEKMALVNLLETEYLNAIDNEILASKQDTPNQTRRKSLRNLTHKVENYLNLSRGWSRVKAVKKTFAKTEKSSKLKVVSRPSPTNLANSTQINLRSRTNVKKLLPVLIDNDNALEKKKCKSFPLNEVELYFNNNIHSVMVQSSKVTIQPQINENISDIKKQDSDRIENVNRGNVRETQSKMQNDTMLEINGDTVSATTKDVGIHHSVLVKDNKELSLKPNENDVTTTGNKIHSPSHLSCEQNQHILKANEIKAIRNEQHNDNDNKIIVNEKKLNNTPDFEIIVTHAMIENKHLQELYPNKPDDDLNIQNAVIASKGENSKSSSKLNENDIFINRNKIHSLSRLSCEQDQHILKLNEIETTTNEQQNNKRMVKNASNPKTIVTQAIIEKKLLQDSCPNKCSNDYSIQNTVIASSVEELKQLDDQNYKNVKIDEENSKSSSKLNENDIFINRNKIHSLSRLSCEQDQHILKLNEIETTTNEQRNNTKIKNKGMVKNASNPKTIVTQAIIEKKLLQDSCPNKCSNDYSIQNAVIASSVEEPKQLDDQNYKNVKIDEVVIDKSSKDSKPVESVNLIHQKLEDDDLIFTLATQTLSFPEDTKINDDCIVNRLNKKILSMRNIMQIYQNDHTSLVDKLKAILNADPDFPFQEMKSTHIQTTNDTRTVYTQIEIHKKDVDTQTDFFDTSHGFRISSTEMFNFQPVISTGMQTESFICRYCNRDSFKGITSQNEISILDQEENKSNNDIWKKYNLSSSFDNLNFETQDIVKGQHINVISSRKSQSFTKLFSLSSNKESQACNEERHFKRDRQPSSDSDSDNEKVKLNATKKKKCEDDVMNLVADKDVILGQQSHMVKNLLENEDISFEFLSELEANLKETSQVPDNCKEIHERVKPQVTLKPAVKKPDLFEEPFPKRVKTQDIIKECEMIIKEACSTTLCIEHTQGNTEPVKISFDGLEEEFSHNFDAKSFDNKPCNNLFHNNQNNKDRNSESIFSSADCKILPVNKENISKLSDTKEDYDKSTKNVNDSRILVVQNIILPKVIPQNANEKVNENDAKMFADNASDKSDEIFGSDEEIIETTPPKNRVTPPSLEAASLLSQAYYNPNAKKNLPVLVKNYLGLDEIIKAPEENLLSCLNETFAPPPEFQDSDTEFEPPKCNNVEEIMSNSSVTPDLLIHNNDIHNQEIRFITSTPFSCISQPISAKSLNLSPIRSSQNYINPILAAQNASRLPLTIVESKTPPKRRTIPIITSNPKQKSILNFVKPEEATKSKDLLQTSLNTSANNKPNVCYTRMSTNQMIHITSLATKKLITVTNSFSASVTHMIVSVDKRNYLQDHTMKYVSAVAAGIWVLNFGWIEECLKQHKLVPEEPFEALDITGSDGPRRSRLNKSKTPLLEHYKIYAAPPFRSATKKEIENVILLLGGEVASKPESLAIKNGKICLIITESSGSQDDVYEGWLEKLKVLTVDLEWLSRSVGQFQTVGLRPFALCSEESFTSLPYPSELLEDVPYSFTTSTFN